MLKKQRISGLISCFVCILATLAQAQTIHHVTPGGTGGGTSWTDPTSLQNALGIAQATDQIWVKTGTYAPGTIQTDTLRMVDEVSVIGGFLGTPANPSGSRKGDRAEKEQKRGHSTFM